MSIDIVFDQNNNEEEKPPDFRLQEEMNKCCGLCLHSESYYDDTYLYCYKYHTKVSSEKVCKSFEDHKS